MKTILVTGASGMLGSAVVRRLRQLNYPMLMPSSNELNFLDSLQVKKYLEANAPDLIFHCAAKVGGIQSNINDGDKYLTTNATIDHNLLYAASAIKVQQLFYIGSSCMYPANRVETLSELDLLTGPVEKTNESYALAKIIGVKTVEALSAQNSLAWHSVIASNLYGPGDNFEPGSSHLLASIIHKIQQAKILGRDEIEVWGSGNSRREFTYVEDLAWWLVDIALSDTKIPNMLNVGVGYDLSVREWYNLVMELSGVSLPLKFDLTKPEGNKRKLMNSDLAKRFGWEPSTTLNDGLLNTIHWYSETRQSVK